MMTEKRYSIRGDEIIACSLFFKQLRQHEYFCRYLKIKICLHEYLSDVATYVKGRYLSSRVIMEL